MPQLDKFTYFTQFFWLCLFFFTFYIFICNDGDGVLGISRILKLRNQLISHQENNTRSKDPNNLEDILRKGFSTGVSYMYSSLFEVSQWCKAVDLLGKRRKITLMFLFRRNKWLTRNGKKHIIFNKEVLIWRFFESWMGDHL
ncbi:ATP synthase protein YMF19 [Linum perenne]